MHVRVKSSDENKLDQIKNLSDSITKKTQSIVEQIEYIEEAAENGHESVVIAEASEHSFSPVRNGSVRHLSPERPKETPRKHSTTYKK